ncbi:hypothetical protein U9M48_032731 [Paspalum notatum var. saurae]|uniref:Protein kinase domain-containing protein n=1 Tax=Paspalum notatum var. saurae TaxID=547442 RepID=A0AAQ3X5S9_PASNO
MSARCERPDGGAPPPTPAPLPAASDLDYQIDRVKGMVIGRCASSVGWKRHPDALMELLQHGIVLTVEESGCFQAKVFLKRTIVPDRLFVEYDGAGMGGSCFRLSLGLLVDCLNIFSALGQVATVEVWYPSPNMRLLLKYVLADLQFLCQHNIIVQRSGNTLEPGADLLAGYNVMVIDLLGPSLEDLFNYCSRKFSLKIVLMLADQMINRVEYMHQKGFLHRETKA